MAGVLDNKKIPIKCPKCSDEALKALVWFKTNKELTCASCGTRIVFDADELVRGLEKANKLIDDFKRGIRRIK